jgi:hypothetical protein
LKNIKKAPLFGLFYFPNDQQGLAEGNTVLKARAQLQRIPLPMAEFAISFAKAIVIKTFCEYATGQVSSFTLH